MIKRNVVFLLAITALIFSACSNNGTQAETKEAEEVEVVQTDETITYTSLKTGSVAWRASHLGGVQKRFGKVMPKSVSVSVNGDKVSNASVVMDMASLTVENFDEGSEQKGQLEGHLKAPDFFDVENNPTSTFEVAGI